MMNLFLLSIQIENYLSFLAKEEETEKNKQSKDKPTKDEKKKKKKEEKKAKKQIDKTTFNDCKSSPGVSFGPDLCLQSYVEEQDEKQSKRFPRVQK